MYVCDVYLLLSHDMWLDGFPYNLLGLDADVGFQGGVHQRDADVASRL